MAESCLTPRRRTLFLSCLYPSLLGSGSQIRAGSLVRMVAARDDVYLMVVNPFESIPGPSDPLVENCCKKVVHLRVLPGERSGGKWLKFAGDVAAAPIPIIDCREGESSATISRFAKEHGITHLFIFRLECYPYLEKCHDQFPSRHLDLDELASRREDLIADLRRQGEVHQQIPSQERRSQAVWRIMEKRLLPRFDKIFVASEIEAKEVRACADGIRVHVLPNIAPPRPTLPPSGASKPATLLFVGTLSYFPNEDAVRFFCREIFPRLRERMGNHVRFRIVGFGCPPSLRPLGDEPGVSLDGFQEDLLLCYTEAAAIVVPLRAGTGTRLKILEAFCYGRPVVSTSIGAEGLAVTHGENILLADDPAQFADACFDLLHQPDLAARLVEGGHRLQQSHYSDIALLQKYDEALAS